MDTKTLIEAAATKVGSQNKLAALLELNPSNLVEMKNGKRPCNWRMRGKLRSILGEDPTRAFITAMAEDLSASENEDEKKAAAGFQAMLAAIPLDAEKTENPASLAASGDVWRKRRDSNPR